jgi:hypothetical protein
MGTLEPKENREGKFPTKDQEIPYKKMIDIDSPNYYL